MKGKRPHNFDRRKNSGQSLIKKTLLAFIIIVFSSSLLLSITWLLFKKGIEQSIFFKIDKVEIEGCGHVDPKTVLILTGLNVKTSMWEIREDDLSARLEKQDWIEKAEIDKDWPSRIEIKIEERVPIAIISSQGKLFYIDKKGVVFTPVLPEYDIDFPIITMDTTVNDQKGLREKYISSALDFLQRAARGNPDLPKQNVSEIHLSDKGLIMFLVDYPFPIYLGENNVIQKYGRLSKVLSWLYNRRKIAETEYIDMNYVTVDEENREQRGKDVMVVFKES